MLLFWRIRYFDTRDKTFEHRDLWLDPATLDPPTRASVELCHAIHRDDRHMLRFRHLFREDTHDLTNSEVLLERYGAMDGVYIPDYFEDENGDEITLNQIARIKTGNPDAFCVSPGAKQHDIDYMLAEKKPIAWESVSLANEEVKLLAYFRRDFQEMAESAFMQDGPGSLCGSPGREPTLQTAVTDSEIGAFVTTFRRLYMEKEPSNFCKAAELVGNVFACHPIGPWLRGSMEEYRKMLETEPHLIPFCEEGASPFTRKRLIDAFIYTQYAHQPDGRRERQYRECLSALGGRERTLMWLFLTTIHEMALAMSGPGRVIVDLYTRYCEHRGLASDILESVLRGNAQIGSIEKCTARAERLLNEKARELAECLWDSKGKPPGGPAQFVDEAKERLSKVLD